MAKPIRIAYLIDSVYRDEMVQSVVYAYEVGRDLGNGAAPCRQCVMMIINGTDKAPEACMMSEHALSLMLHVHHDAINPTIVNALGTALLDIVQPRISPVTPRVKGPQKHYLY